MSGTSPTDNTEPEAFNNRLGCPGCVRAFKTELALNRHLTRNPSHGHDLETSTTFPQSAWDNGWVTFDDRVERAILVPHDAESVDVAVRIETSTIEITGDHETTVPLPETAGACVDTLRWQVEDGILRFTLDR